MSNDPNELKMAYFAIEQELLFSSADASEELWMKAFLERINDLILHDFNRLISILYRLDISESRLRSLLQDQMASDETSTAKVICKLIIERQLEKITSRKQYRQDGNISEEEKW